VASHLVTDHYHYWERGGGNYMEQFGGADFIRGHENDYFVSDPCIDLSRLSDSDLVRGRRHGQHLRNITRLKAETDYWSPQVLSAAGEWLERNRAHGPWLLAAECFDPHEPFNVPPPYDTLYGPHLAGETYWPDYGPADRCRPELLERVRKFYAGKVTMFDAWLGRLLDRFDRLKVWDDAVIVFTTDHGHFLGEHNQLGKPRTYPWQTLFHIPLVIHAPGAPEGVRCEALSTAVDLNATLADALGLARERPGHGRSLLPVVRGQAESVRDSVLMGYFGEVVGFTDGRHKLHQAPLEGNRPLYAYGHDLVTAPFCRQLRFDGTVELGDFMPQAGVPVLRLSAHDGARWREVGGQASLLFDLAADPGEERDLAGSRPELLAAMRRKLRAALEAVSAPAEHYERLGL
jgi:arylsulfatase A-like enzyme